MLQTLASSFATSPQKRRGGGIEPLCVSTPRELKSRPSTSLTHHGTVEIYITQTLFLRAVGSNAFLVARVRCSVHFALFRFVPFRSLPVRSVVVGFVVVFVSFFIITEMGGRERSRMSIASRPVVANPGVALFRRGHVRTHPQCACLRRLILSCAVRGKKKKEAEQTVGKRA